MRCIRCNIQHLDSIQEGCSLPTASLLNWENTLRSRLESAAAAGGAAALADVAAAGRAHLRSAGEAQRGVRRAALLELDQLGGGVRSARPDGLGLGGRRSWDLSGRGGGRRGDRALLVTGAFTAEGLGKRHRVDLDAQRGRILSRELRGALGGGQDAELGATLVGQVVE